jgi:sugar lactone lactonase YvrE
VEGPEVVVAGMAFPEGLAWSSDEGCLLCTAVQEGVVYRIWPEEHRRELMADVGGGANNLTLARGGGAVVCQNGGVDAGPPMAAAYPDMPPLPPGRTATAGLMHVDRDGTTSYILSEGVNAPNDVTVTAAGDLLFTDPGNPFLTPRATPRMMRYSHSGGLSVFAEGFDYCNGIFVDGESVLVTDHGGVLRFAPDGSREWVVRYDDGQVDGLALDVEGRMYVTRQGRGGVDVIEGGQVIDFLALPGGGHTTNASFGGPELSWLFVTDARNGSIHVFTGMPARGLPVAVWAPSDGNGSG